jgi:hypothetical protein
VLTEDGLDIEVSRTLEPTARGLPFLLTPCDSLAEVRTVICGQSHMAAVASALVLEDGPAVATAAVDAARDHGMAALIGWDLGEPYLNAVRALARSRGIVISWNGNQPIADFLLTTDGPFDFMPRDYPDASVDPDVALVPEDLVRAHFAPTLTGFESLMDELSSVGGGPVYVMAAPPPLGDNDLIRGRIAREAHFVQRAALMGVDLATIEIMPAGVRRKLWFTLQAMMREIADAYGAVFIPPPPEAFDETGFLKVPLSQSDVSHANHYYGRYMTLHIAAFLKT